MIDEENCTRSSTSTYIFSKNIKNNNLYIINVIIIITTKLKSAFLPASKRNERSSSNNGHIYHIPYVRHSTSTSSITSPIRLLSQILDRK